MCRKLLNGKMIGVLTVLLALFMAIGVSAEGALAELLTVVPEGVTEIDLRTVFGDDVTDVEDAWMLNADICVILQQLLPETEGYALFVWDKQNRSILSRTHVPFAEYYRHQQGWENGALYLLFVDRSGPEFSFTKAIVAQDGTVDVGTSTSSGFTIMPGGKTAVRETGDGSLYAVDLDTGEEELLIQGVAGFQGEYSKAILKVFLTDRPKFDSTNPTTNRSCPEAR
jgi:hypothetical protein